MSLLEGMGAGLPADNMLVRGSQVRMPHLKRLVGATNSAATLALACGAHAGLFLPGGGAASTPSAS